MRVLLVEPGYKNAYPPLGLMKIAAYHRRRGDYVLFVKGIRDELPEYYYDRVYVTTLFTFQYRITVETIRFYKKHALKRSSIYVGGIAASLMSNSIRIDSGVPNVVEGILDDSSKIGYHDHVNIDRLVPDYSILGMVDHKYRKDDSYYTYATRGCPNKCVFCAVPQLEPVFFTVNGIWKQIREIDRRYGSMKDLMLMDNNILHSPALAEIVDEIKRAGFVNEASFVAPSPLQRIRVNYEHGNYIPESMRSAALAYVTKVRDRMDDPGRIAKINAVVDLITRSRDPSKALVQRASSLEKFMAPAIQRKPSQRYVDFNQGVDARLITEKNMALLSEIPVKPLRIAFDNVKLRPKYENAVRLASKYGMRQISNYLLYNFLDRPEELWERIMLNVELRETHKINIFSFPMRYSPVDRIDRQFVGKHWNKKFLRAIQAVLLAKKGIVSSNRAFVERAFGKDLEGYFTVLYMPTDFIIYRSHFEEQGLTAKWLREFDKLSGPERKELIEILSLPIEEREKAAGRRVTRRILPFYGMKYEEQR